MPLFELAHHARPRSDDAPSIVEQLEAAEPWDAVTKLRETIPDDHVVAYVRRLESPAP